jgi:DNA-binding XRE family transcriptional regulator
MEFAFREHDAMQISDLRAELGLSLEEFAVRIGLSSKGYASELERGGRCSLTVALAVERLSSGRIDAAALNSDVAEARRALMPGEARAA